MWLLVLKILINNNFLRLINCFEIYNYFIKNIKIYVCKKNYFNGMEEIFRREMYFW